MSDNRAGDEEQGQGPGAAASGDASAGAADAPGGGDDVRAPRLAALTAERDEIKDRMLRIAAEFENWKKRARKDQLDAEAKARESVLRDMLEIADNLERAVSAQAQSSGNGAVDAAALLKGVNLVLRLLQQRLERHDVRPFDAQGQPFDPRLHEAISRVESAGVAAGSVAAELQKGYKVGDRLLRPAMVSVSTGPRQEGDGGGGAEQPPPARPSGRNKQQE